MAEFDLVAILGESGAAQYRRDKATVLAAKSLEKSLEALDKKIKSHLLELGEKEYAASGFTFKMGVQDRSTMNEEKLVALLKEKGLDTKAVKTVEIGDPDAVAECIKTGELTVEELSECKNPNIINTMTVKYVPTEADIVGAETGRFPADKPNESATPKKMF